MHSKCLDFFLFKFWAEALGGGDFFHFSFVPSMLPSSSQWVPVRFPMCSPRVLPIAPLIPYDLPKSPPHLTYIGQPKGEELNLSIDSSILGNLHSFNIFCNGPIKLAHCKKEKEKVELVRHP